MKRFALSTVAASFVATAAWSAPAPREKVGSWELHYVVDPITDAKRPIASAKGDGGLIVLKCDTPGPGSVYAHLVSEEYLGSLPIRRNLTYRVDGAAPVTVLWAHDKSSAILTEQAQLAPFIRALRGGKKLALRASTYDHETVDFVADIDGSAAVIDRVYRDCGDTAP